MFFLFSFSPRSHLINQQRGMAKRWGADREEGVAEIRKRWFRWVCRNIFSLPERAECMSKRAIERAGRKNPRFLFLLIALFRSFAALPSVLNQAELWIARDPTQRSPSPPPPPRDARGKKPRNSPKTKGANYRTRGFPTFSSPKNFFGGKDGDVSQIFSPRSGDLLVLGGGGGACPSPSRVGSSGVCLILLDTFGKSVLRRKWRFLRGVFVLGDQKHTLASRWTWGRTADVNITVFGNEIFSPSQKLLIYFLSFYPDLLLQ